MELTAKEKAKQLVDKMKDIVMDSTDVLKIQSTKRAKQCAIIAVDEILQAIDWHEFEVPNKQLEYWQEVKQEINNL